MKHYIYTTTELIILFFFWIINAERIIMNKRDVTKRTKRNVRYSISVEQDAIDQEGLDLVRAATFVEACKGVIVEHT